MVRKMLTKVLRTVLMCAVIVITPLGVGAAYNPMIPGNIYTDGGLAESRGESGYGVLAHTLYFQIGILTKGGFIPYGNPLALCCAYDPSDVTIPESTRESLLIDPGITIDTLRLISGKYVVTLVDWLGSVDTSPQPDEG